MSIPERGDLVYVNFSPQSGHEQAGRRPGIVLTPALFNQVTGFAVVCPITNQVKGYPYEVLLPAGLRISGVVLADQVRSLDWASRGTDIVGQVPEAVTQEVLDKVHTYL